MFHWNVVVNLHEHGFRRAFNLLQGLGAVYTTECKSFHVRMHRRGFKGRISSHDEERFLDKILLEELGRMGNPGHITFEDPDAILVVETVGQQAGLSCWNREDLQRYPLLRLD